jgi:hypothetical protein
MDPAEDFGRTQAPIGTLPMRPVGLVVVVGERQKILVSTSTASTSTRAGTNGVRWLVVLYAGI